MSELKLSAQARALHLSGVSAEPTTLEEAVEWLARLARKKDVEWVEAQLSIGEGITLPLAVRDRGRVVSVDLGDRRRRYALSVDGLQSAIADWIREKKGADAASLDLFEQLLQRG